MNIQYMTDNEQILAGTTLKSETAWENGNLALHTTDDTETIIKKRRAFTNELGLSLHRLTTAAQTHSANIHEVTASDKGRGAFSMDTAIPDTDALYTTEPGILLGTLTADCVPVVFFDKSKKIAGVIHSGWQGTIKEITRKVFTHLRETKQSDPENIHVHLGPALSQEKFEVDTDVYEKYAQLGYAKAFIDYNEETNKYHIDNQKVVQKQCEMSGVPISQISCDRTCTFLSKNHFSYREDRHTGRHLSFIMIK